MVNGQELVEELHGILADQVDDEARQVIQNAIDGIELRDTLLTSMNEFIESEHRGDFEDTLDHEQQEQYREFFELSVAESDDFVWPQNGGDEDDSEY